MLLYELAIALDRRSPELMEAGNALGLGDLQAATDLAPEQVAALRAHFGGGVVPPPLPALGSDSPPLPAVASGPLVAAPFSPDAPVSTPTSDPQAPASWGPPTAPPNWGPPPGAAPPPPDGTHPGPHFAYPEGNAAEVVESPLGLGEATLPPAPAPAPAPAGPPSTPDPVAGPMPSPNRAMGTGQKVLIGGAVAAVAALVGFMALTIGPDKDREQALATNQEELESKLNATTAPAPTTTVTTPPTPGAYDPADVEAFCRGGLAVGAFELRIAAALADEDFASVRQAVQDGRATWSDDVTTMASGAAPILVNDIERYRGGYDEFFDAISSSSSLEEAYAETDRLELARSTNAAQEVGAQVAFECQ